MTIRPVVPEEILPRVDPAMPESLVTLGRDMAVDTIRYFDALDSLRARIDDDPPAPLAEDPDLAEYAEPIDLTTATPGALSPQPERPPVTATTEVRSPRTVIIAPRSVAYAETFKRMADVAYMQYVLPAADADAEAKASRDYPGIAAASRELDECDELMELIVDVCGNLRKGVNHKAGISAQRFYEQHVLGAH